jgi:hypothetical protein
MIMRRMSIRSTVRLTGVPQDLVKAIVVQVGSACARYHRQCISKVNCGDLQCGLQMVLRETNRGSLLNKRRLNAVGSPSVWT